jgi:hypothetical protein
VFSPVLPVKHSSKARDERKAKARDKSEIASVQSPLNDQLVVASEPGFFVRMEPKCGWDSRARILRRDNSKQLTAYLYVTTAMGNTNPFVIMCMTK